VCNITFFRCVNRRRWPKTSPNFVLREAVLPAIGETRCARPQIMNVFGRRFELRSHVDAAGRRASAIRAEFYVGDDWEGHYSTYMRSTKDPVQDHRCPSVRSPVSRGERSVWTFLHVFFSRRRLRLRFSDASRWLINLSLPLQPFQLVSFLLTHRNSFHPSALRLSRGTLYFGQLGTSHFGATDEGGGSRAGRYF